MRTGLMSCGESYYQYQSVKMIKLTQIKRNMTLDPLQKDRLLSRIISYGFQGLYYQRRGQQASYGARTKANRMLSYDRPAQQTFLFFQLQNSNNSFYHILQNLTISNLTKPILQSPFIRPASLTTPSNVSGSLQGSTAGLALNSAQLHPAWAAIRLSSTLAVGVGLRLQQWRGFVVLFVTLLQNMTSLVSRRQLQFLIAYIILIDYPSTMAQTISEDCLSLEHLKLPPNLSSASRHTQDEPSSPKERSIRKISDEQKEKLIRLITVENYNMKDAAKIVKISYSTAKKVFTRFRRALRQKTQPARAVLLCKGQAGVRDVGCGRVGLEGEVRVVSTIAGKEQIRSHNIILIGKTHC